MFLQERSAGRAGRARAMLALVLCLAVLGGPALAAPPVARVSAGDDAGAATEAAPGGELQEQVKAAEAALAEALAEAKAGDADGVLAALEDFFQALVAMEGLLRDMPSLRAGPRGPRSGPASGGYPGLVRQLIVRLGNGLAEVVQALPAEGREAVAGALRARAEALKDHPLVPAVLRAARHALGGGKPGGRALDPERLAERLAQLEQAIVKVTERAEEMAARIAERRAQVEAMEEGPWKAVAALRLRAMELEHQRTLLLIQKLRVDAEAIRAALEAIESGAPPPNGGERPSQAPTGGF